MFVAMEEVLERRALQLWAGGHVVAAVNLGVDVRGLEFDLAQGL